MKTLNWRHTDVSARIYVFQIGQEIIGQLRFNSYWNFNAVYADKETKLRFIESNDFLRRTVSITRDGKLIGKMRSGLFAKQTLELLNGEKYVLTSNLWGRDVRWENSKGEPIMKYQQATMASMEKGVINLKDTLTEETEKLLMSAGLFMRQLILKRILLIFLFLIPILAASKRY
jgi:hypothetical protein